MQKLEKIFSDIYGNGFFQLLLTVLTSINGFMTIYDLQANVFMLYRPDNITCATNNDVHWISKYAYMGFQSDPNFNLSMLSAEQCYGVLKNDTNVLFKCNTWNYPRDLLTNNILMELNLICDRAHFKPWLYVNYLLSMAVGYFIAMYSDITGRKVIYLTFLTIQILSNIAMTQVSHLALIFICLFIRGTSDCMTYIAISQITELLPVNKRGLYGNLFWIPWCVGYMGCPGVAWWLKDWRYVKYVSNILLAFQLTLFYLFPKSPRLLLLRNKKAEAIKVWQYIAWMNRAKIPDDYFDELQTNIPLLSKEKDAERENKINNESLWDGLRNKIMGSRIVILAFSLTTIVFSYYGLITSTKFLSSNIFLNVFLQGSVEFPGIVFAWIASDKFGRRISTFCLMMITSVCILLTQFLHKWPIAKAAVGMLGKLTLTSGFSVADVYIVELMPTSIRNAGFFFCMLFAAFISSFTPLANNYFKGSVAIIVYGVAIIIGAILILFCMPETKGIPLPNTIEESQGFIRGKELEWAQKMRDRLKINPNDEIVVET